MTTPFYAPPDAFHSARVVFPEDEARHAAQVLRKQPGDEVVVVDGAGGWHHVRLGHVSRRQVVGHVLETKADVGESSRPVTVAIGLLKKRSRFETFVEKAVEVGVHRIQPLKTARTERDTVRHERLQRIAIAAMKQCQRSHLPTIKTPMSFPGGLQTDDGETDDRLFLCHEQQSGAPLLARALAGHTKVPIRILIGPEGGFTDAEVETARAAGATVASLGPRRLRAETAGIVAATVATMHEAPAATSNHTS